MWPCSAQLVCHMICSMKYKAVVSALSEYISGITYRQILTKPDQTRPGWLVVQLKDEEEGKMKAELALKQNLQNLKTKIIKPTS